jgi:glutaconate CoA-transferase, subunit B
MTVVADDQAFTADEMMTVCASRALGDRMTCFVGIGLPSAAANLARATHAPGLVLIYESGTIGTKPGWLPLSIGDGVLAETADAVVSVPEIFNYWLQPGRIDVGFLGAAQLDRFGNINTTVIGDSYDKPKVRLPGAGGAPEIAASCREVIIGGRQSRRSFVDRVDFVTSVGYGDGAGHRERLGLTGAGPVRVITDLGVLEPDAATRELTLTGLYPGVTPQQARERTGWDLAVSGSLQHLPPPSPAELTALRALQAMTPKEPPMAADPPAAPRSFSVPVYERPAGVHPPLSFPDYRSTGLRAPRRPLTLMPHRLTEITGPLLGEERVTAADADLTMTPAGEAQGQRIIVTGRVLDSGGRPVPGTLIEVWQANAAGRYAHAVDNHPAPLDENFTGVGRCLTDDEGRYRFVSIKPGAYPWKNHPNAWRPAHIHFSLFGRAFTQRLVTQMYFEGDPLFGQDPIFNSVPDPAARERLVARFDLGLTEPEWALGYRWDIVLRGREATVFEEARR